MYRSRLNPPSSRQLRPFLASVSVFFLAVLLAGACGGNAQDAVPATSSSTQPATEDGDTATTTAGTDQTSNTSEQQDPSNSLTPSSSPSVVATRFATLGGWDGTGWVTYGQPDSFTGPANVGDTFSIVQVDGSRAETTMESVGLVCGSSSTGILTNPELPSDFKGSNPIAVRADWDLQPYKPPTSGTAAPLYFDAVRKFFAERQVDVGPIEITQWFKLDLEGDGVDEVVLSARSQGLRPGQESVTYPAVSVILLRRVVDEVARTYFLSHSIFTEADGASLAVDEIPDIRIFAVSAFTDLNGDGKLEIVINDKGFESVGTTIWEFINDQVGPRIVLSGGCGS